MRLAVASAMCATVSHADMYMPKGSTRASVPTMRSTDDAVKSLPVLSKIPTSFLVGDGFKVKLSGMELRIDHMGTHSKAVVAKRNCMLSISYASPVAFFGTRLDLPLITAQTLKTSAWEMNTPGDYVLRFSKDASVQHPVLGLSFTARF
jgi:hypothetical protein